MQAPRTTHLRLDHLEDRSLPSAIGFRTFDGTNNNVSNPDWGSTGESFLRGADPEYGDGISTPAGADRPSPRLISNELAAQTGDTRSRRMMSALVYVWGQFIDHDLTLTGFGTTENITIPVPKGDPWFDPRSTGTQVISTTRSAFDPETGTSTENPREQFNEITAWMDGSMIYGSDADTAAKLRSFEAGRMKIGPNGLLPLNDATNFPTGTLTMINTSPFVDDEDLFAAGDIRANENIGLTALQTLFVREHNRWAARFAAANPDQTDEQIFQRAREVVIAEIQAITYREWLPTVIGGRALDPYRGYQANVDPQMTNEFSTAAFRFGHSLLGDDFEFLNNLGMPIRESVSLAEAFSNPDLVKETNIDPLLKYLASDTASELDTKLVDGVRNFLFGPPGAGGLDLAALNIARGRDHGLADYNATRVAYGLPRITDFSQITPDRAVQDKLRSLYGSVDNIDLWVGGLAEKHVPGANVGPTFQAIIAEQFERIRDGDRFWYTTNLPPNLLREVQNTTLSDIIRRNTSLTTVQKNAFTFRTEISGNVLGPNRAGRTVQLLNADGEVVATKRTNARGEYIFTVGDGLGTGVYRVRLQPPTGSTAPTQTTRPITIVSGDKFIRNVNFAPPPPARPTQPPPPPVDMHGVNLNAPPPRR